MTGDALASRASGTEAEARSRALLPRPPAVRPRLRMHRVELAGMVLIGLVPLLALLGVFGPRERRVHAEGGVVALDVRYPARLRRGMTTAVEARIANRSSAPLESVTLTFDSSYVRAFTDVAFTPSVARAYAVELSRLQPGEVRVVVVELVADHPGRHGGRITATHGPDGAALTLSTLVYP